MYKNKTVSIVMPAFNEEENIFHAVKEFGSISFVDEVVVIDNNSKDSTNRRAVDAGARVVVENRQGYGYACQRALREAKGDIIILVEPDGTFSAHDVEKFLAYSNDFDFVIGTRTSKEMIYAGANMGAFLKWGNWFLGKLIEVLYNAPSLTDVGCTYRLINRSSLNKIMDRFTVGGSYFSPEMMILAIQSKISMIEISVGYRQRTGVSKITGKKWNAFKLGLRMIKLIFAYKIKNVFSY
ncbi:MAG: glycosyltransferase family 2 protein [Candidatus Methanoperedens sp.]|nr:glycosyltransferase family 2 protein [Candidatus Methanoperedens sp.]